MSGTSSSTGDAVYSLEDADITSYERDKARRLMSRVEGVAYVELPDADSALAYVGLENGRSFDADDTPNPLAAPSADEYDPDGVRHALAEIEFRHDVACVPSVMYMVDETVEYAVPIGAAKGDRGDIRPPYDHRGNIAITAHFHEHDLARAYFRALDKDHVTVEDAPVYTEAAQSEIDYLTADHARDAFATVFGFDADGLPYGDFRDAPEEVQAEHARDMAELVELNRRMAERLEEYDPEKASRYRNKALSMDCTVAAVPSEWLDE